MRKEAALAASSALDLTELDPTELDPTEIDSSQSLNCEQP